jgi:hypothetical protein
MVSNADYSRFVKDELRKTAGHGENFVYGKVFDSVVKILCKFEERMGGKRGCVAVRSRLLNKAVKLVSAPRRREYKTSEDRHVRWCNKQGKILASKVSALNVDEHGIGIGFGDVNLYVRSFISPWHGSRSAPYFDMGGEGLALVSVTRTTVYSKAYMRRYGHGSTATTVYLVGKNEGGMYFAHAVHRDCHTIKEALNWIWGGYAHCVIARQGDIALIKASGPKMPSNLPSGHVVIGDAIVHRQHPAVRMPQKGERIIVGRRASTSVGRNSHD